MTAPTQWQRWVARHSWAIVTVCLVAVAVVVVFSIAAGSWWPGIVRLLSATGFVVGVIGARQVRRFVTEYDARSHPAR